MTSQRLARALSLERELFVRRDGLNLWCDLFDLRFPWVLGEIMGRSIHSRVMRWFLRPGDSFVDAGANHGAYALRAARHVGPSGAVHAIEPQTHLARLLERSAAANDFAHLRVHEVGLSDRSGSALLALTSNSGASHVVAGGDQPNERDSSSIRVVTIDSIIEREPLPPGRTVLKMDVEGREHEALMGAAKLLSDRRPVIVIEMNPVALARAGTSCEEVISLLVESGYERFTDACRAPALFDRSEIAVERLHDLVAVPAELAPFVSDEP